MKLPEWNKTQKILIGVLAGVMLCVIVVVLALVTRPAQTATASDKSGNGAASDHAAANFGFDDPEIGSDEISLIEDSSVSVNNASPLPPDLVLTFRADADRPLPEEGARLCFMYDQNMAGDKLLVSEGKGKDWAGGVAFGFPALDGVCCFNAAFCFGMLSHMYREVSQAL